MADREAFLTFEVEIKGNLRLDQLQDLIKPQDLEDAAESGLVLMKLRIQRGERADGNPFKPYAPPRTDKQGNPKPVYIPLSGVGTGNPLAKPKGGQTTAGVGGKPPQTMKFASYAEFRQKAGRGTLVNFTLSGNTTGKRFRVLARSQNAVVIGWPAGSEQAMVAAALDAREDGQCFSWSPEEAQAINDVLAAAIAENLKAVGVPLEQADVRLITRRHELKKRSGGTE